MTLSVPTTPVAKTSAVLLTGVIAFAALYAAGLRDIAWVGFLAAGLLWSPMSRTAGSVGEPVVPSGERRQLPVTFSDLEGGTYSVLPESTRVIVKVRKLRLFTVTAAMDRVNAHVDRDASDGHLTVRGSVPVGTFRSGNNRRDLHVLGPAFLDAEAHPTMRFTSTAVDCSRADRATITGDLTLRGRTRPVTWDVCQLTSDPTDGSVRAVAHASIRRSDWGITGWMWLVDDTVSVRVELVVSVQ